MGQYIRETESGQLAFTESDEYLKIPSTLYAFHNTETEVKPTYSNRNAYCFNGEVAVSKEDLKCPNCGRKMHIHGSSEITLSHIPIGGNLSKVRFPHTRFKCPHCGTTKSQFISFKADNHRLTKELYNYIRDLLALGLTNKKVSEVTGVGKNIIKEIDKKRLLDNYTLDGKKLKKPDKTTRFLGIDEFKLHDHYQYATVIIDMETGHVLWIEKTKKKQVVYDFIDHVGMDWMEHVVAVACDMNSDFQEAFEEMCEWIQPIYDYFHIVKNFNDKVISEIRKDEQRRLREEGDFEGAEALKKTRYILMSNRETLQKKDELATGGIVLSVGDVTFNKVTYVPKGNYESKYQELLDQNKLLFTCDLIKEKLKDAYDETDEMRMADKMSEIMDLCEETNNKHLLWFRNLIDTHFEGIIAHATYQISNGKLEGLNNKIKTVRRQAFGYRDDEYFFLKIFDTSRQKYVRNQKSHRICD